MNIEHKSASVLSDAEIKSRYGGSFHDFKAHQRYFDPLGFRGEPINAKKDFYEADETILEKFDELQQKGFSVKQSIETIQKNLDTGDWSLPIYHLPEVSVVNPRITPLADLMPRETVQSDTVKVNAMTAFPSPTWSVESTGDPGDLSYTSTDATYTTYSYDIVGMEMVTHIEDKMRLASNQLTASQSVAETSLVNGIRYEEEKQMIQGDGTSGNANSSDGWKGLVDLGNDYEDISDPTAMNFEEKTRELINQCEEKGGDRNNMAVITDFTTYRNLCNELDDFTRYNVGDSDTLGFGFETLEFDGCPVYKSAGFANQAGSMSGDDPIMFAVDMSSNYLGMLNDVTIRPLARTGPQERIAVDSYSTLVSEAQPHIQFYSKS